MRTRLAKAALAAYPVAYRRRYGEELEALLAESEPDLSDAWDLLRGAFSAHLRPAEGVCARLSPEDRVRASACGVLASWILFAAAGLAFYKTTEGDRFGGAASSHLGLWATHGLVQLLAAVASLLVVVAAAPLVVAILRRVRVDREARTAVGLAAGAVTVFLLVTATIDLAVHPIAKISAPAAAAISIGWTTTALACSGACWVAARRGIYALKLDDATMTRTLVFGSAVTISMALITVAVAGYGVSLALSSSALAAEPNGPLGLVDVAVSVGLQASAMFIAALLAGVSTRRGWRCRRAVR
jgi:hypothetical protein